jgi:hypothetical protein
MHSTKKLGNASSLALLLAGAAALGWAAVANGQGGTPTTAPTTSPAATPGSNPIPSPTTNPFGGGLPFSAGPGSYQFRGGFNGNWLAAQAAPTRNRSGTPPGPGGMPAESIPGAFSAYYLNPWAAGAPGVWSLAAFNVPIYSGGAFGLQGSPYAPAPSNVLGNGLSPAAHRNAAYTASPDFDDGSTRPNITQSEVEQVLARSTTLNPHRKIRVVMEGAAVVLRGTVASQHDRRLAEALVRLVPGVNEVRNELQLPVAGPRPNKASSRRKD